MKHSVKAFSKLEFERQVKLFYQELKVSYDEELISYWNVLAEQVFFSTLDVSDISNESDRQKILNYIELKLSLDVKDQDIIINKKDGARRPFSNQQSQNIKLPHVVVLHNLRSSFNIGSILRTAECFAFKKVYLTGYSATPENLKVQKTAMETDGYIDWERFESVEELIKQLKKEYKIVVLETVKNSKMIYDYDFSEPCAIFLGNESLGVDSEICEIADEILQIPMFGWKNSLNVGASFSVCGYEIHRQRILTKFK